jgi:hypothetical protein
MALKTRHSLVFTGDGIARMNIVIELDQMAPSHIIVTSLAKFERPLLGRHLVAETMIVFVTRSTG